jgi:hypothetical protein
MRLLKVSASVAGVRWWKTGDWARHVASNNECRDTQQPRHAQDGESVALW